MRRLESGDTARLQEKLDAGGFLRGGRQRRFPAVTNAIKVLPAVNPDVVTTTRRRARTPTSRSSSPRANEYGIAGADDNGTEDDTSDDTADTANTVDIGDADKVEYRTSLTGRRHHGEDAQRTRIACVRLSKSTRASTCSPSPASRSASTSIVYSAQDDVGNDVEDEEEDLRGVGAPAVRGDAAARLEPHLPPRRPVQPRRGRGHRLRPPGRHRPRLPVRASG